ALLAMTGGGRSSLSPLPNGLVLVRALAMTIGDGPPRRFAPAIHHTLSLRRRVADCGNPRDCRDRMDRHVASLLAMTGGGGKVHRHHHPTARPWSELSP